MVAFFLRSVRPLARNLLTLSLSIVTDVIYPSNKGGKMRERKREIILELGHPVKEKHAEGGTQAYAKLCTERPIRLVFLLSLAYSPRPSATWKTFLFFPCSTTRGLTTPAGELRPKGERGPKNGGRDLLSIICEVHPLERCGVMRRDEMLSPLSHVSSHLIRAVLLIKNSRSLLQCPIVTRSVPLVRKRGGVQIHT